MSERFHAALYCSGRKISTREEEKEREREREQSLDKRRDFQCALHDVDFYKIMQYRCKS